MTMPGLTTGEDGPDIASPAQRAQQPALEVCRDVMGGTLRMRERATAYLPQAPGEAGPDYYDRLNRAVLYNAMARTVRGLAGMVFRTDPVLGDDVPPEIRTDWENIDLQGNHGDVFSRMVLEDMLATGHTAILVDFPDVMSAPPRSLADERASGLRPYWVLIRKDDIVSWRTTQIAGHTVLTQFVFREMREEADGEYRAKEVTRYRVFRLTGNVVTWEVWAQGNASKYIKTEEGTVANQTRIPVGVAYGRPPVHGPLVSVPPLLDLAHLNVQHYQIGADYGIGLHMSCVPTLVIKGRNADPEGKYEPIILGPHSAIDVPMGGDATYIEHSGSALGAARQAMQDIEGRMASLGLSMLVRETRAAETAEAKRIDKTESDAPLAVIARGLQDCLELCFEFHANYRKVQDGGSVVINREFSDDTLDAAGVQVYSQLVTAGQLSLDTLWEQMQAGGVLPADFDAAVERFRIAADLPAMPEPFEPKEPAPDEGEEPEETDE